MAALARNPKSPVALALNLLPRLTDRDLKVISTDHNVADVVRTTARRKVVGS
jgi:ABC-type lipopolysaccharide export system ATPase subunit